MLTFIYLATSIHTRYFLDSISVQTDFQNVIIVIISILKKCRSVLLVRCLGAIFQKQEENMCTTSDVFFRQPPRANVLGERTFRNEDYVVWQW